MARLKELELMIQSRYPVIAIATVEEDRLEKALEDIADDLKVPFWVWSLTAGLKRPGNLNSVYDTQEPLKALNNIASLPGEGVYLLKDIHRFLEKPEIVRKLQDLGPAFTMDRRVIALCAAHGELPPALQSIAAAYTLELPSVEELKTIATRVLKSLSRERPVKVELTPEDFGRLVERMKGFTAFEAERAITKAIMADHALTKADFELIIDLKKQLLQKDGVLEYIAPEENLAEVGGFKNLKAWLAKRTKAFAPEAARFGITAPKGLLLLGVQGCGKTLVARAIAREWGLPLLKMETGRLYDKYIGESEKNLEKALKTAEHMAPCVLMIDELEKALSYGGGGDGDSGLSKRVFGRILGWLQDRKAPVFVVATCNDITSLPPELTRKGRFDEIFFIDLPGRQERHEIFAVHLTKRKRNAKLFDLAALAEASEGFSGAEIEQVVVAALLTAFSRGGELTSAIIAEELRATRPLSVTRREEIDRLRAWAADRTVSAS
jgi:SpoVK/Ycf46/Vps4 family AAA+-type ATPase